MDEAEAELGETIGNLAALRDENKRRAREVEGLKKEEAALKDASQTCAANKKNTEAAITKAKKETADLEKGLLAERTKAIELKKRLEAMKAKNATLAPKIDALLKELDAK